VASETGVLLMVMERAFEPEISPNWRDCQVIR